MSFVVCVLLMLFVVACVLLKMLFVVFVYNVPLPSSQVVSAYYFRFFGIKMFLLFLCTILRYHFLFPSIMVSFHCLFFLYTIKYCLLLFVYK